jgi:hypothetical protein
MADINTLSFDVLENTSKNFNNNYKLLTDDISKINSLMDNVYNTYVTSSEIFNDYTIIKQKLDIVENLGLTEQQKNKIGLNNLQNAEYYVNNKESFYNDIKNFDETVDTFQEQIIKKGIPDVQKNFFIRCLGNKNDANCYFDSALNIGVDIGQWFIPSFKYLQALPETLANIARFKSYYDVFTAKQPEDLEEALKTKQMANQMSDFNLATYILDGKWNIGNVLFKEFINSPNIIDQYGALINMQQDENVGYIDMIKASVNFIGSFQVTDIWVGENVLQYYGK